MQNTYNAIGVMSGTSLDGLDIAYCRFTLKYGNWNFKIIKAQTHKYSEVWTKKLSEASELNANQFTQLDADYGHYIGKYVKRFIDKNRISVDLVASHGQTIFHQPEKKLTVQIGCGAAIAAETGGTVICDFRTTDIAMGGQGAPLVPIGDEMLFSGYHACLNIGGFANISYKDVKNRMAYDICPANAILNLLAKKTGADFDFNGEIAEQGKVNDDLLINLNRLNYFTKQPPKSLGMEWLNKYYLPLITDSNLSPADLLRTFTEHIAIQIAKSITAANSKSTLATGGGVHNIFLVKRINAMLDNELMIPSKTIIDYKEALIFAFLGVLRIRGEANCLKNVTGAVYDNCGGAIYSGKIPE